MAKVTDIFVNGSVGNVIFYRCKGTRCVRIKRTHIGHLAAMKRKSMNFGMDMFSYIELTLF
jgi:hypothetical protein